MSILVRPGGGGGAAVSEIYIATPPNKTVYKENETLDITGMVVKAKLISGSERDITDKITTDPAVGTPLQLGVNFFTVKYVKSSSTFSTTQTIEVKPEVEIVDWATGTNAQIAAMVQAADEGKINLSDYWAENQVRTCTLKAMPNKGTYKKRAGDFAVGESLYTEGATYFGSGTVIFQGNPDPDLYDESCNGTWVVYPTSDTMTWDTNPDPTLGYADSDIHKFINDETETEGHFIYDHLGEDVKNAMKTVKIPYYAGFGSSVETTWRTLGNGLQCKCFLLSINEAYDTGISMSQPGALIPWLGDDYTHRQEVQGWLRDPAGGVQAGKARYIDGAGDNDWDLPTVSKNIVPVFILDPDALIDAETDTTFEIHTQQDVELVLMHEGEYPLAEPEEIPITELAAGDTFTIEEDGSPVEYIVIHQGNPDPDMYDTSCDGTWVRRKEVENNAVYGSGNNFEFPSSTLYTYLHNGFLDMLSEEVKSHIKQVKIPYYTADGVVHKEADGCSCKVFVFSAVELGKNTTMVEDGVHLGFYPLQNEGNEGRIVYMAESALEYFTRSPFSVDYATTVTTVGYDGAFNSSVIANAKGYVPSFILDSTFTVTKNKKCNFVVGMKNCLAEGGFFNLAKITEGGWDACDRRQWCNVIAYNALPDDLRPIFKKMVTVTNAGFNNTPKQSEDYLALFAAKEIMGANAEHSSATAEAETFQFNYYKTPANANKTPIFGGGYGTRSCSVSSDNATVVITANGTATQSLSANIETGISFFGCI